MINLADIVAASNRQYDSVVNVLNSDQPVAIAMFFCFVLALVCISVAATCDAASHLRNGCVLNTIVVTDDSSNVYVINADTNEIVQLKVSDSEEVAKLLSEKFQS